MARLRGLFVLCVVWTFAAGAALAQEGEITVTDDDVNRVAKQLYCPQCESTPLDTCPTAACIAWRQQIRDYLAEGWSDQDVIDYFVREYGQRVLAAPSDPLINLLLAVVPIAALVVGVIVFYRQYSKWQRNRADAGRVPAALPVESADGNAAPSAEASVDDQYRARLERELDEVS